MSAIHTVGGRLQELPVENRTHPAAPETQDFMEVIRQKKEEIMEKVLTGKTEPVFQTGGAAFTVREWDTLLERVDKAIDAEEEEKESKEEEKEIKEKEKEAAGDI